jgi:hypothetical protein
MAYTLLADLIVALHFGFILFVFGGGLLVLRWPRAAWLHIIAIAWSVVVEFTDWINCPLTPWEQELRARAGRGDYSGGFTEHYLLPLIHLAGLTPGALIALAVVALSLTGITYRLSWQRHHR